MNELKLTSQFKKDLKRYKHKAAVIGQNWKTYLTSWPKDCLSLKKTGPIFDRQL